MAERKQRREDGGREDQYHPYGYPRGQVSVAFPCFSPRAWITQGAGVFVLRQPARLRRIGETEPALYTGLSSPPGPALLVSLLCGRKLSGVPHSSLLTCAGMKAVQGGAGSSVLYCFRTGYPVLVTLLLPGTPSAMPGLRNIAGLELLLSRGNPGIAGVA